MNSLKFLVPASLIASALGLSLSQPVQAADCDRFSLGIGIEADNCRSQIGIKANTVPLVSIEQFKLSLATQLPIAIASYNQTATAMIAQRQVKPSIVVAQGNQKNLPIVSVSVEPSQTAQIALNR